MSFIITRTAKISFTENTLLTEMFDNLEIDLNDVNENYEASVKLTQDKNFLSLVIAAPFTTITKEARDAANREFMYKNTVVQAIIVQSIANRIMGNFLIKFYKPFCPLKLFKSREEAVAWLNEKWNEHTKKKKKVKSVLAFY